MSSIDQIRFVTPAAIAGVTQSVWWLGLSGQFHRDLFVENLPHGERHDHLARTAEERPDL
jgi:hypothetical protein